MKISYQEPEDERINAKRPFWKEYLIIWFVMLFCCSVTTLLFIFLEDIDAGEWTMVVLIGGTVFVLSFAVSIATRMIHYMLTTKPFKEIRNAARKVAAGDFTARVHSLRKDDRKDEIEVLIDDFNKMVEELAATETMKTDFIANVSHEMKTPLAVMSGYVSALQRKNLPAEQQEEYLYTIAEAIQKLTALITNILRLNKLEVQEIIHREPFSLDEQLRLCVLAFEEQIEEKKLELEIELEEVLLVSDADLLEIVWNNLLGNALKFTEPGGEIGIRLKREGKIITVRIWDTGCGMTKEAAKRIFDRFYQGDTSHAAEGNGLGMAMVKRILVLVEGEITVESQIGQGTSFEVVLKEYTENG